MRSRRMLLILAVLVAKAFVGIGCGDSQLVVPPKAEVRAQKDGLEEAVTWLEQEANRVIRASKRDMQDGAAAFPPQVGSGYDAFWLRDYEYMLEGAIASFSKKELTDACRLFVRSLNADGAGVDCVKYDGTPIYKPGYGSMGYERCVSGEWSPILAMARGERSPRGEHGLSLVGPIAHRRHAAA